MPEAVKLWRKSRRAGGEDIKAMTEDAELDLLIFLSENREKAESFHPDYLGPCSDVKVAFTLCCFSLISIHTTLSLVLCCSYEQHQYFCGPSSAAPN